MAHEEEARSPQENETPQDSNQPEGADVSASAPPPAPTSYAVEDAWEEGPAIPATLNASVETARRSNVLKRLQRFIAPYTFPPRWEWFTLFTLLFIIFLMVLSAMLTVEIPNVAKLLFPQALAPFPDRLPYSLQLWAYAFSICLLGFRLGVVAFLGLLLASLFLPVFATGGGLGFFFSPAFIYVVGAFLSLGALVFYWERHLKRRAWRQRRKLGAHRAFTFIGQAFVLSFFATLALHGIGALGVLAYAMVPFLSSYGLFEAKQILLYQSIFPFWFDMLGFALILLATPWFRAALGILLYRQPQARRVMQAATVVPV